MTPPSNAAPVPVDTAALRALLTNGTSPLGIYRVLKSALPALLDELDSLRARHNEQVDLTKACEHIAEGEPGWEKLANLCPSTAAVTALRARCERMERAGCELFHVMNDERERNDFAMRDKAMDGWEAATKREEQSHG